MHPEIKYFLNYYVSNTNIQKIKQQSTDCYDFLLTAFELQIISDTCCKNIGVFNYSIIDKYLDNISLNYDFVAEEDTNSQFACYIDFKPSAKKTFILQQADKVLVNKKSQFPFTNQNFKDSIATNIDLYIAQYKKYIIESCSSHNINLGNFYEHLNKTKLFLQDSFEETNLIKNYKIKEELNFINTDLIYNKISHKIYNHKPLLQSRKTSKI